MPPAEMQMTTKSQLTFTQADVDFLEAFGKFLVQKTKMELSIPESVQLNKYLGSYNQLTKKIEAHIFELKQIIPGQETSEESK